jgi:redox-sensitive bicupin YhaK (pirin superfamily)
VSTTIDVVQVVRLPREYIVLIHDRLFRGNTKTVWLDSYHTFSFGGFHDPARMGHRALRVLSEDVVIPGAGFGAHGHEEMDILTYVISGALRHQDSIGNASVIRTGELQHMYAGTGVIHCELNASESETVHFLQIWIMPDREGGAPSYFKMLMNYDAARNTFLPVAGPDQDNQRATLGSDTWLYLARLDDNAKLQKDFAADRAGFLHIVDGIVEIDGHSLSAGDGLQFDAISRCAVTAKSEAELLLFDLA